MSENSFITQQWVSMKTDKDGKAFFQKHQGRVMAMLSDYNLSDIYNYTSGSALHSRLSGLAVGYKSTFDFQKILAQEFHPEEPRYFMIDVIFRVL
jgi:hypothetical protein